MTTILSLTAILAAIVGLLGCIGMILCLCSSTFDSKKSEDNKK